MPNIPILYAKREDSAGGTLGKALGHVLGSYAGGQFRDVMERRKQSRLSETLNKYMNSEEYQNMPIDQKLTITNAKFGNEAAKMVLEAEKLKMERGKFSQAGLDATKSQRAAQVNKIADSQRTLILNNFKGPLGEIKFTGKEGAAAKKALQQIEKTRQKKLTAIFGKDLPEEFQEEFTAANKFFSGDFTEIPAPAQDESGGGFFSRLFSGWGKNKEKTLTDEDVNRIAKEVKSSNPGATPQQLQEIAMKKAKEEGFSI